VTAAVTPRDAATVMLVRDGKAGMEVFMLRRTLAADFIGGAYVFPGGAVDPADRRADLEPICAGRTDAEASARLGLASGGLAFWVAAVRECFEEAGVLLACDADGVMVRLDTPEVEARFAAHRAAVDSGERRLVDVCAEERLRLAVGEIHYFSHWITPEGAPRRYDTRFFVARAPDAQVPLHDDNETIANLWVRPADALERYRRGELELILPTIRNLTSIAEHVRTDDLLDAAKSIGAVVPMLPKVVNGDGGRLRILLPGDEGYEKAVSRSALELGQEVFQPGRVRGA
jgi:8-oxo-dGTP pyrophosphatase MutT (NUDIX family)